MNVMVRVRWKYMLNKDYRSLFMLIRVRLGKHKKIVIPLPLFVFEETIIAIFDLFLLPDLFYPIWQKKLQKHMRGWAPKVTFGQAINLLLNFFDELRKHGRWRMVEVETEKARIYIDFY